MVIHKSSHHQTDNNEMEIKKNKKKKKKSMRSFPCSCPPKGAPTNKFAAVLKQLSTKRSSYQQVCGCSEWQQQQQQWKWNVVNRLMYNCACLWARSLGVVLNHPATSRNSTAGPFLKETNAGRVGISDAPTTAPSAAPGVWVFGDAGGNCNAACVTYVPLDF
jgi:hypothetical protein